MKEILKNLVKPRESRFDCFVFICILYLLPTFGWYTAIVIITAAFTSVWLQFKLEAYD